MFHVRNICKLCQVTQSTSFRNLRKNTVVTQAYTPINLSPDYNEDGETKHVTENKEKPIIECKNKELNHYPGKIFKKFDIIPIASRGWDHYKSKGDYFTIYPQTEDNSDADEESTNFHFENLNLDYRLIGKLKSQNIIKPSAIQQRAIPVIFNEQNVILQAQTGCGKTLAYLLPIIDNILRLKSTISDRSANSPFAVIISPSQELALQIGREAKILGKGLDLDVAVLTGGHTKKIVRGAAVRNVDILVGTLGIISKVTAVKLYKLNYIHHTVIDEAHALFDETFEDKMKIFLNRIKFRSTQNFHEIRPVSQLVIVSATMPEKLPEYLSEIIDLRTLIDISLPNCHRVLVPQKFFRLGELQKPLMLLKLIKSRSSRRIPTLIFTNNSSTSDWISIFLNKMNITTLSFHGAMKKFFRKNKFWKFQNGEVNIITTTNAGARGLDTTRVESVINYDFPLNTADYIHRCGRTGRIGSKPTGEVINFITKPLEIQIVQKIERAARRNRALPMFTLNLQDSEKSLDEEIKDILKGSG